MKSILSIIFIVNAMLFYYYFIHYFWGIPAYSYLAIMNVYGFLVMAIDKSRSVRRKQRISERHLFVASALGGSVGTTAAMFAVRHKTKHWRFRILLPLLVVGHLLLVIEHLS